MSKYLYIAIETNTRELDAKILLALQACSEGYTCIIGPKTYMHKIYYSIFPRGILFYKDSLKMMENFFMKIKKKGHKIVVHDEEGYVQWNWDDYLKRRIKSNSLKYIDAYFCWGKKQFEAISMVKSEFNPDLNLFVIGHPRIDLLKEPIKQYNVNVNVTKKVILINTKFGDVNYKNNGKNWIEKYREGTVLSTEENKYYDDMVEYKTALLEYYRQLVYTIAVKFQEESIVIRPHPTENIDYWKQATCMLPNVLVTNEYPIGYWLNQAKVVLHTGCTTAIEAFIMKIPSIAFKPITDMRYEITLPNSLSFNAFSIEDCIVQINTILSMSYDKDAYILQGKKVLSEHLDCLDDDFSYNKIINILNLSINDLNNEDNQFLSTFRLKIGFFLIGILNNIKFFIYNLVAKNKQEFFSSIELDYVEMIAKKLGVLLDKKEAVCISKISKNIIQISMR